MAYTTIKKPSDYFNTKIYTGNGSTQSITGVGFEPDWIWGKNRDGTNAHWVNDVIRGVDKRLVPNLADAEDDPSTNIVTSFDSDGFSLGSNTEGNNNADNYVAWNWKAGGTGVSNTDGSITSTVSANTTSGFSIVKWTGTGSGQSNVTIGHGLGAVPKVVLFKQLDAGSWVFYHQILGKDKYLVLNTTDAEATATGLCNPTSINIVLETSYNGTNSTAGMIAYCFEEVKGFSKFGSYTGNGNADGPFIYTGFKPAFVMTKRTDSTSAWLMYDNKRNTFNLTDKKLLANESGSENLSIDPSGVVQSSNNIDILSNGFKQRTSNGYNNGSGATYIYMAFAEEPLVGDSPSTAR